MKKDKIIRKKAIVEDQKEKFVEENFRLIKNENYREPPVIKIRK